MNQETQPARRGRTAARWLAMLATPLSLAAAIAVSAAAPSLAAGTYATTTAVNVRSGPGTGSPRIATEPRGATFTLQCQWQGSTSIGGNATWDEVTFGNGLTGAISDDLTTTPSFNSYAPGTGPCASATPQMQAAAAWVIAEKNSPNPAWSDHYQHYWSGWCEEFAEQAEGFQFRFATAIADYHAEFNAGRIHTDTNPPVGALVFYGGGGGAGHVAVSIGNGQEIGTYGFVGDHYPVSQYPVIGYLSNPYLGWALPFGS
jgi:uncharacterized protein YraI